MNLSNKISKIYAKLLSQKNFIHTNIAQQDGQIVDIAIESYKTPTQRQKSINDRILDEQFNFPLHNLYVHKTEQRILIVYRGTDVNDLQDIISDIQIILGTNAIDVRIQQSLDFFDQVKVKYPEHQIRVTGHSLGGTIALIIAKHRLPERTITFNPGSAPTKSFLAMMQDTLLKKERTTRITTYKIF